MRVCQVSGRGYRTHEPYYSALNALPLSHLQYFLFDQINYNSYIASWRLAFKKEMSFFKYTNIQSQFRSQSRSWKRIVVHYLFPPQKLFLMLYRLKSAFEITYFIISLIGLKVICKTVLIA